METVSKIRRWVKSGDKSIHQVSRETGISRNTIRKYLRDEHADPKYKRTKPTASKRLVEYEALLRGMYEADLGRALRERRTLQGLYEALVIQGFEGSYDTVGVVCGSGRDTTLSEPVIFASQVDVFPSEG